MSHHGAHGERLAVPTFFACHPTPQGSSESSKVATEYGHGDRETSDRSDDDSGSDYLPRHDGQWTLVVRHCLLVSTRRRLARRPIPARSLWSTQPSTSRSRSHAGAPVESEANECSRHIFGGRAPLGLVLRTRSRRIRLTTGSDEVLIHSIPKKVAAGISISTPPAPRENSALKPVFEVQSLSRTLQRVEENGGVVTSFTFRLGGITRHDILDPDGNIIQLRSSSATE
jgi:predicted enzyme related to lactoylglutathione lyase